jgi:hypothetical protein
MNKTLTTVPGLEEMHKKAEECPYLCWHGWTTEFPNQEYNLLQ